MKDFTGTFVGIGVMCLTNDIATDKLTTNFEVVISKIYDNNYHVEAFINKNIKEESINNNITLESIHSNSNSFLRKSDLSLTFSVGLNALITYNSPKEEGDNGLTYFYNIKEEGLGLIDLSKYEKCSYIVFNLLWMMLEKIIVCQLLQNLEKKWLKF